ncbi:hypothetical protein ACFYKX_25360 [Cytobacillus sp. FJAT-54145]|uniref:Uncharacterized protein n=1 Tax=Cytobacillus spartinae TaxID=3299023 RepID=A0ABW6KI20_9BACI
MDYFVIDVLNDVEKGMGELNKIQATMAIGSVLYDLRELEIKLKNQFEEEKKYFESGATENKERTTYFQEQWIKVRKAIYELEN